MKISCPHCAASINAPEAAAGKQAKCPGCKKPFVVAAELELTLATEPPPLPSQQQPSSPVNAAAWLIIIVILGALLFVGLPMFLEQLAKSINASRH